MWQDSGRYSITIYLELTLKFFSKCLMETEVMNIRSHGKGYTFREHS